MSFCNTLRWKLFGVISRGVLWLWFKSTHMVVLGEDRYRELRSQKRAVIVLVWHGRIFIVPCFFRKRGMMPLISPSKDGEIASCIMSGWGYKILRGSSSHSSVKAWKTMKQELFQGGEVIIVPDGPKGPNREMKLGGVKLAQETGAVLIPFTFSTDKKKELRSWDKFLMFYPFRRVVAVYGEPIKVDASLGGEELEKERKRIGCILTELDEKADRYFCEESMSRNTYLKG